MSTTSDALNQLAELHRRGELTDDEFARAKARVLQETAPPPPGSPLVNAVNKLRRSATDRWVGGVCGGLSRTTGVDTWIWRLGFALLALWGGSGLVAYLLLWIFVPRETVPAPALTHSGV